MLLLKRMFDSLKKKLGSWLKKSTEKVKEVLISEERPKKKVEKVKVKKEGRKKTQEEIEKEREVTEKVVEDIKQEELEIKTPEEKFEEVAREEMPKKKGFFSKLFGKFKFKISKEYFQEIFSELELVLLENNVALEAVEFLKNKLEKELVGKEIAKEKLEEEIKASLKLAIEEMLKEPFDFIARVKEKHPFVILFFGINGSGKTTTIAKLAYLLKKNNISCVLAASDTFRAASIEQLQEHAKRLGIEIIKSQYNADPASVAFDAIKHAQAKSIKAVLIDTAGRMHTKSSLLKEMEKISRVSKPDLKLFIGESVTGNDVTEQAKIFQETVGIDGIILSKADVDEKPGAILSVSYVTGKPIIYLGTGQGMDDLKEFKKEDIIKSLGL